MLNEYELVLKRHRIITTQLCFTLKLEIISSSEAQSSEALSALSKNEQIIPECDSKRNERDLPVVVVVVGEKKKPLLCPKQCQ